MTDEQIIKALECCADQSNSKACQECPYNTKALNCVRYIVVDALALIQRQKAEIERLTNDNEDLFGKCGEFGARITMLKAQLATARAEIERLKAELEKRPPKLIITRLPKEGEK